MNESHGSSTIRNLSLIILALALVAMITLSCGSHPQGNGITWDNTAEIERNRTQQVEIVETNQTERTRSDNEAKTAAEWALTWRIVGVAGAAALAVWAWSRRPHRPQPAPAPVVNLLAHYPGHVAELIDGEWCIVEPVSGEYYTAQDASRLLTMRQ